MLPLFEVEAQVDLPKTKIELVELVRKEQAVCFHRYVCPHCQRFPGLEKWLNMPDTEFVKVKPFSITQLIKHSWFIALLSHKHSPFNPFLYQNLPAAPHRPSCNK